MPNGHDKNLVRLYEVVSGFRQTFGTYPTYVLMPRLAYDDLVVNLLSPVALQRLEERVTVLLHEEAFAASDEAGRRYDYLSSPTPITNADIRWLGLEELARNDHRPTRNSTNEMKESSSVEDPDLSGEYLKSSFYEQLVEHVFVAELLQEAWFRHGEIIEVLRSEVDASGFDLVLECRGVLRHVQLKTSRTAARTGSQKVSLALASKPSGCVVWILRDEDHAACRMQLRFLYFGADPGQPLPSLDPFRMARHTKADSTGTKKDRPGLRVVPKTRFEPITDVTTLLERLFGAMQRSS